MLSWQFTGSARGPHFLLIIIIIIIRDAVTEMLQLSAFPHSIIYYPNLKL